MIQSLLNQGINQDLVKVKQELYRNLKAQIVLDIEGPHFEIRRGVRQGDPLSPLLFNCALEEIFKNLEWENLGIKINGERLSNLRFANDVVLVAESAENLQSMIDDLVMESKKAGLEVNLSKTKILSNEKNPKLIKIGETLLENTEKIIYLGQLISFQDQTEIEIKRRIAIAWKRFWKLSHILKQKLSISFKSHIFNSCIVPALSYGSQTWSLSKTLEKKLQVTQNTMERTMLNLSLRDRVSILKIKKKFRKNINIVHQVRRLKWDWAGHVSRMTDGRWTHKISFWQPTGKRRPGRQKARWEDNINKFTGTKLYHRLAADRTEWSRLREAYAQNQGFVRSFHVT